MSLPERHSKHASDFAEFLSAYSPTANRSQRQLASLAFSKGIDSRDGKPMRATVKDAATPTATPTATPKPRTRSKAKSAYSSD